MKTVLSVTVVLMLALSLGAQPNPSNADTKKFKPGPITAVPVTAQADLFIRSVIATKCICTPNKLDQADALYMEGIKVEVFNPSNVEVRDVTVRVVYHNMVSGGVGNTSNITEPCLQESPRYAYPLTPTCTWRSAALVSPPVFIHPTTRIRRTIWSPLRTVTRPSSND